jgi:hypothetical protein
MKLKNASNLKFDLAQLQLFARISTLSKKFSKEGKFLHAD